MKSFTRLVLSALLLASPWAQADTVYRCGNSYSQQPCPGGTAVPTDDPRSPAQRAAARQALARDQALAQQLEQARRKDESAALARERMALAQRKAAERKAEAEARKATAQAHHGKGKRKGATDAHGDFTVRLPKPAKS